MIAVQKGWVTKDMVSKNANSWSIGDTMQLTVDLLCMGPMETEDFLWWNVCFSVELVAFSNFRKKLN